MALGEKKPRARKQPQGILPFDYELGGEPEDITARGGLPLALETMQVLGVPEAVREHVHIRKRDTGYSELEHVEALVLLLCAGGEHMDDMALLGADRGLLCLLDKQQLPSPDATRQFLLAFHDEGLLEQARQRMRPEEKSLLAPESEPLLGLGRVLEQTVVRMQQLSAATTATLEMDATCIESRKREAMLLYEGGRGYQPEVVYWVEQDLVVADEFRDGNVPAGKGPLAVIERGFARLPASVEHRRFRADSACYEEATLKWLADPRNRIERFTVSADMSRELHALCLAVPDADWKAYEEPAHETVCWSEVEFTPGNWGKTARPLRTLVRRVVKRQGELFAHGGDRLYLAIVSNDTATEGAALIRWHYQKAGHIEIVHDVLKNELGGGVLPCGAFGANAAWFRLCCLAHNVLSAMKTHVLPPKLADARPKRLRFAVFTMPARVLSHARRICARVAAAYAAACELLLSRRRLRRLWDRLLLGSAAPDDRPALGLASG